MSKPLAAAALSAARSAEPVPVWARCPVPGLLLTGALAGAAYALRRIHGVDSFSPMIIAILLGTALHNSIGTPAWARAGVVFSLKRLLRLAIILLGLQLTTQQVMAVGGTGMAIIAGTLLATFLVTKALGRALGVERRLAELIAAGTSICGASAVIATNSVTRAPDEDVAYAVACVTVFGSLSMFLYPALPGLLHLDAGDLSSDGVGDRNHLTGIGVVDDAAAGSRQAEIHRRAADRIGLRGRGEGPGVGCDGAGGDRHRGRSCGVENRRLAGRDRRRAGGWAGPVAAEVVVAGGAAPGKSLRLRGGRRHHACGGQHRAGPRHEGASAQPALHARYQRETQRQPLWSRPLGALSQG